MTPIAKPARTISPYSLEINPPAFKENEQTRRGKRSSFLIRERLAFNSTLEELRRGLRRLARLDSGEQQRKVFLKRLQIRDLNVRKVLSQMRY